MMRVAAVQIAPVFLDAEATLAKAIEWLEKAAGNGAEFVVFPEAFVPSYPSWAGTSGASEWINPLQSAVHERYVSQSLYSDGPELAAVAEAASRLGTFVYFGFAERSCTGGTVYATLAAVHPDKGVVGLHRKLQPTHHERVVWGPGDGRGLEVHDFQGVRVGGLNCWENWMPLARYAMYAQGEQIHAMTWPGHTMLTGDITRFLAMEGRVFAVSSGALLRDRDVPDDFPMKKELFARGDVNLDGGSMIVGPDGQVLAPPVSGEETILYADCDLSQIEKERQYFDPAGHYGRTDVFKLSVSRRRLEPVDFGEER
jgi:nitrilase